MMRRRPFNFGGGPRMFGRGDLKYALLGLLQEHPKHGYEMIKDMENRSGGFYSPSAGAIYPTLQLLEDRDWVSVEVVEGKKIYTITDAGRQALKEYQERASGFPFGGPGFGPFGDPDFDPHGQHGQHGQHGRHGERPERPPRPERPERPERPGRGRRDWGDWGNWGNWGNWGDQRRGSWGPFGWQTGPELRAILHESQDVARLVREAVLMSGRDAERLTDLREILAHTRNDLLTFISQRPSDPSAQQPPADQPGDQPDQPANGEGPVENL